VFSGASQSAREVRRDQSHVFGFQSARCSQSFGEGAPPADPDALQWKGLGQRDHSAARGANALRSCHRLLRNAAG